MAQSPDQVHDDSDQLRGRIAELEKKVEKLQAENETFVKESRLFHAVMNNIPDAVFFKDRDGRFIRVNNAWASKREGLTPEQAIGATVFDYFPEENARRIHDDDEDIVKRGKLFVGLIENLGDEENPEWVSTTKLPLRDENNNVIGTFGISRDITELKKAEDAIEKERNLLYTLIDNLPDTIFFKDRESQFIINNKAHMELLGVSKQSECVGKTDFEFFPGELAARYFADEQVVLQTGRPIVNRQEPKRTHEGSEGWLSTNKVAVKDNDGNIIGLVGISRDITEHRRIEQALEKERTLLRTLIDNMPDFIFIKDKESRFIVNNKAHLKVLGASGQDEVLGKTDFDIFPKELATRYFSDEQVVIQTGRSIIDREEPARLGEQTLTWLSTTKVPLYDTKKQIVGLVGISRDITERKQFEEALQKAVEERTADLKDANERLELRLAQLRFLNTSSYELAQFIQLSELGLAVINAFMSRFPDAEASLCIRQNKVFKYLNGANVFKSPGQRKASEKALIPFQKTELHSPFCVEEWSQEEHISQLAWPEELKRFPCYLAIPLLTDNRALGIIQIFTEKKFLSIFEREKPVLTTLAAQAAVCLSNAIHYKELGERARLQGELDAARSIQQRFTPHEKPSIPHVDIKGVYYPAYEVGGDYLDYFPNENGDWVVVIADVCGKGIPAALFMTMLRSAFRAVAKNVSSAKTLLCLVNEAMMANLDDKSFVTALCFIISKDGSSMSYARAGHPMLLKLRGKGEEPDVIKSNGLALGLLSDPETFASMIDEITMPLNEGSRFLIYTDGLTEATDPVKNSYGSQRLHSLLAEDGDLGPDKLIEKIMEDVSNFTQDSPYHDDLTILAMKVDGRREKAELNQNGS
ncbi:MAG: PAS domain-containing protein [Chitinivibrionales bacterium]|nr:PAS domain-containing protein [Chitinivibrionales bacterium]